MSEPALALPALVLVGQHLQQMAGRLAGADRLTEQVFLQIGERVRDGYRQAVALAGQAESAHHSREGDSAEQIVAGLQSLTEHGASWLAEARNQSQAICAILLPMERDVEQLSSPLRGLGKVVKTLQALRVSTRIEAARSHGHGALVLGQELQSLGASMQEKLELIAERCAVLASLCRRAAGLEEQAQAGPLRDAEGEIRQVRRLLENVAQQCIRTTDRAAELHQRSSELAGNFGELVAALQFQDITRQRLQHIGEALQSLASGILSGSESVPPISEVCRLQYDQLHLSVSEFCEAVLRLDANLRAMTAGVQLLADDTRSTVSVVSHQQCAMIEPALQAVTTCLEKVLTIHLAAGQAVFAVCQAVRDVADLAGDIELLGEEMQLLAQNAAVSAAHGQVKAAGLTVIAGNIQLLAVDAGRHAVAMAGCCRRISDRAEELDACDQQFAGRGANLEALLDEAHTLVGRLQEGNREFDGRIGGVVRQASCLRDEMQNTLADFDVRQTFLAQVEPVLDELLALSREYGVCQVGVEKKHATLNDMRRRYTMKSERDVHQRFLERNEPVSAGDAATGTAGDLLGSNVELF